MTRDELLAVVRKAPPVGSVTLEEFADHIVVLSQRKKIDDEWVAVETLYMAVDGKVAMANADHHRQGKRLDFLPPQVLAQSADALTLLVGVQSELYGIRYGIATSRITSGKGPEREFPWEVAETSAIGRALTSMGYGLIPGAGLASAEDMLRVENVERQLAAPRGTAPASPRTAAPAQAPAAKPAAAPANGKGLGQTVTPFGKHKGKTIQQLWDTGADGQGYLKWVVENMDEGPFRTKVEAFLIEQEGPAQAEPF